MMVCIKISVAHRNFDLVDLLKILTGHEIIRDLCRKCIECNAFDLRCIVWISGDLQHILQREHHLDSRT